MSHTPPTRILLVDDFDDFRFLMTMLMDNFGYSSTCVSTPEECLDEARDKHYDLYILDVSMPIMTGIELSVLLKEEHPDVPVLFLTAYGDPSVLLEHGEAYLAKPFVFEEFQAKVESLVHSP